MAGLTKSNVPFLYHMNVSYMKTYFCEGERSPVRDCQDFALCLVYMMDHICVNVRETSWLNVIDMFTLLRAHGHLISINFGLVTAYGVRDLGLHLISYIGFSSNSIMKC